MDGPRKRDCRLDKEDLIAIGLCLWIQHSSKDVHLNILPKVRYGNRL